MVLSTKAKTELVSTKKQQFTSSSSSINTLSTKSISKMTFLAMILSNSGKHLMHSKNQKVSKIFANAFSSTSSTSAAPSSKKFGVYNNHGITSLSLLVNGNHDDRSYSNSLQFSTDAAAFSSSSLKATVEEDLDSALDDILGKSFEEAGDIRKKKVKATATSSRRTEVNGDAQAESGTFDDVRLSLYLFHRTTYYLS